MPNKKEFERVFNELLGLNINWSKLSKDELLELGKLFNDPAVFLEKIGSKVETKEEKINIKGTVKEAASSLVKNWNFPVIRKLMNSVEDE